MNIKTLTLYIVKQKLLSPQKWFAMAGYAKLR
jgi:hypothetical protein